MQRSPTVETCEGQPHADLTYIKQGDRRWSFSLSWSDHAISGNDASVLAAYVKSAWHIWPQPPNVAIEIMGLAPFSFVGRKRITGA